jgi:hypothetical protein
MFKPILCFCVVLGATILADSAASPRNSAVVAKTPEALIERIDGPGTPFGVSPVPLKDQGYLEEEFQVRGEGRRYRIANPSVNAQAIDASHPFVTRALVRRPADPSRFNGTVLVEWFNVSTGQDIDFVYAATRDLVLREGYAWVGVSVQRNGLNALKLWNPARYKSLNLDAPLTDPVDGKAVDVTTLNMPPAGDVLGWDVFTQIGAAVRKRASPLMGGLPVEHVIAVGESQSAFRLSYYFNTIQPMHQAYDGFLLYDRAGPFALRTDVNAKLVSFGSEFMVDLIGGSPADTVNQRWWEVAGSAHVSVAEMEGYIDPKVRRDAAVKAIGRTASLTESLEASGSCKVTPVWSRVPNGEVMMAALKSLNEWIAGGPAPVNTPRLVVDDQNKLVRDEQGRVLGGIRTAAYDAPRATNVGANSNGSCMLAGYHQDFSASQMCKTYVSKSAYVARVRAIVSANVRDGVLLPPDAVKTVADAEGIDIDCSQGGAH